MARQPSKIYYYYYLLDSFVHPLSTKNNGVRSRPLSTKKGGVRSQAHHANSTTTASVVTVHA
jgi:hypothetical protein